MTLSLTCDANAPVAAVLDYEQAYDVLAEFLAGDLDALEVLEELKHPALVAPDAAALLIVVASRLASITMAPSNAKHRKVSAR
ncbi:hypothetical protein ACFY05_32450 [Microtetraspora fusca]|uniref:Uncharacterized protein n=1 Tax=Microtetraspora fusca TaxID=1997 RepID=A0ABW6VII8_MICFU